MSRPAADYSAIKAELNNNPLSLPGYLPLSNAANDSANADVLNLVRTECQVDRTAVSISELQLDRNEFNALSPADQTWIQIVTQSGSINPKTGGTIRAGFHAAFAEGTITRTAFDAILTASASRAAMMFALGLLTTSGAVTPSDVAQARNAT